MLLPFFSLERFSSMSPEKKNDTKITTIKKKHKPFFKYLCYVCKITLPYMCTPSSNSMRFPSTIPQ